LRPVGALRKPFIGRIYASNRIRLYRFCQAQVIHLGRIYKLTAYDATYLELAMRRVATLATFDRKLTAAARAAGVRVFGESL
jgi:predicted nucleic acid-binding protein